MRQLSSGRVRWGVAHKLNPVGVPIPLDKLADVPIFHPLRNQSEPVFSHCHSKKRQDVRMPEVPPSNALPTESLQFVLSETCDGVGKLLTPSMTSRSLVTYMRTTLTATRRP